MNELKEQVKSIHTSGYNALQTRTLYSSQGTPCELIPTGKNLFSLQGTPVLTAGSLFSLQGFPCKPLYFPVWNCSESHPQVNTAKGWYYCSNRVACEQHAGSKIKMFAIFQTKLQFYNQNFSNQQPFLDCMHYNPFNFRQFDKNFLPLAQSNRKLLEILQKKH